MNFKQSCMVLLFLLFPLLSFFSRSQAILLTDRTDRLLLNRKVDVYLEKESLFLEQVVSVYQKGAFISGAGFSPPRFYIGHLRCWYSFTIQNDGEKSHEWILNDKNGGITKSMTLYVLENNSLIPYPVLEDKYQKGVFPITCEPGRTRTFFLYSERFTYMLDLELLSPGKYAGTNRKQGIFYGIFFGILFVMVFYNLMLFFSLGDISYIYYVLHALSFALFHLFMFGLLSPYFVLTDKMIVYAFIARNSALFFFGLFAREFLKTSSFYPKADRFLIIILFSLLFFALLFAVLGARYFTLVKYVSSPFLLVLIVTIGIFCLRSLIRKYRPALFFFLSFFILFNVGLFYLLVQVLPTRSFFSFDDVLNLHLMEFGQLAMIILMSLGLADRISLVREEKEKALEQALFESQKSATLFSDKKKLAKELELAQKIQTALLPGKIVHKELEIEAAMVPAIEVGGDYYDISFSKHNDLWISIGDVSGHGMTPGLIMMIALTIHKTIITLLKLKPSLIVQNLNLILADLIQKKLGTDHMMSFTTVKYLGKGNFIHSGLHMPYIIYRKKEGTCELIETEGMYLNMVPDISKVCLDKTFTLDRGDILLLYTDGIIEAKNKEHKLLDLPGLMDLLKNNCEQDMPELKSTIIASVQAWIEGEQKDDMTIVLVKRVN